ncbi:hypothetical protein [Maritalea sp.]|uniref:hypothetical protein n=1 Tax=Maritalea sp. TaxID=2003361 RepID=UPI003EFAF2D7
MIKPMPQIAGCDVRFGAHSEDEDAANCMRHLLSATAATGFVIDDKLALAWGDHSHHRRLRDCGLFVRKSHLAVMNEHWFLSEHFIDTTWCLNWQAALVQLPGAFPDQKIERFNVRKRTVVIPRATIEAIQS